MELFLEHHWDSINPEEWNRLCLRGTTNTIFQTYQWHAAWMEEFGKDHRLFLVRVVEGNELVGLAPLMIIEKGKLRILKFIGTGHSDYCDFIYERSNQMILKEIWEFLKVRKNDWDAMALDNIPQESPTAGLINEVSTDAGFHASLYSRSPCPVIIFDADKGNVKELTEKKSLQRHYQYFQKKGAYEVLHLNTAKEIAPFLEKFFEQHIQRCEKTNHKSLFGDECNRQFYKNLVKKLCPKQWLDFTVVQSQGHPIAFHFGLSYDPRFIWYKPSFDVSLSKYSPGEVLLRELLIFAEDRGFKEFDFSIGNEAFKRRFANHKGENHSFKIFKSKRDYWAHEGIKVVKALSPR